MILVFENLLDIQGIISFQYVEHICMELRDVSTFVAQCIPNAFTGKGTRGDLSLKLGKLKIRLTPIPSLSWGG